METCVEAVTLSRYEGMLGSPGSMKGLVHEDGYRTPSVTKVTGVRDRLGGIKMSDKVRCNIWSAFDS